MSDTMRFIDTTLFIDIRPKFEFERKPSEYHVRDLVHLPVVARTMNYEQVVSMISGDEATQNRLKNHPKDGSIVILSYVYSKSPAILEAILTAPLAYGGGGFKNVNTIIINTNRV